MTDTARPSDEQIAELFDEYRRNGSRRVRNRLVEAHMGFAIHVARRYMGRGVAPEDLRQVAMLALVKAVDRFEPERGFAFSTFAGRTIEGEIKRHFRDATWAVRVPRSAKELHLQVRRAIDDLQSEHGRSPTAREVAAHLGLELDEVVTALAASAAHEPASLDRSRRTDEMAPDRNSALATAEAGFRATDDRLTVEELLDTLPEREREIIRLRFYENLTQSEIAERVGISQMHVSRLLRRSYAAMRSATQPADAAD